MCLQRWGQCRIKLVKPEKKRRLVKKPVEWRFVNVVCLIHVLCTCTFTFYATPRVSIYYILYTGGPRDVEDDIPIHATMWRSVVTVAAFTSVFTTRWCVGFLSSTVLTLGVYSLLRSVYRDRVDRIVFVYDPRTVRTLYS